MAIHRFFERIVNNIEDKPFHLSEENVNYAKNVLRLGLIDNVLLCDGQKGEYLCAIEEIGKSSVTIRAITTKQINENEPEYSLTIFQSLPKADKMDLIIQKCVELGVRRIVPFFSERTVIKGSFGRNDPKTLRWNKISEAAALQCRRGIVPEITEAMTIEQALVYAKGMENPHAAVACESGAFERVSMKQWIRDCGQSDASVFIGPEGGFSDGEIELFAVNGITCVSMGKRILRTETAPIVFAACFCYEYEKGV